MNFSKFAEFLEKIEKESSRNVVTEIISEFIENASNDEISYCFYIMQGRLYPKYKNVEFNLSRKLILKAFAENLDNELKIQIKDIFKIKGDLGLAVEEVIQIAQTQNLQKNDLFGEISFKVKDNRVSKIHTELDKLAKIEGKGSQELKANKLIEILSGVKPISARYIIRLIIGSLRLGVSDKTILDSLSWYKNGDKSLRKVLDSAFGAKSDIGELSILVKTSENLEKDLSEISLAPGIPVASKLVEREKDSEKVWERMPNCFVQPKLDGLRGQIHYLENGEIQIYSRNMENMTAQFPEFQKALSKIKTSLILDSEIIGFNRKTGEYLTYQETMQRKRKYDVEEFAEVIPVKAMCFDVLYYDGKDLSKSPIEERIEILKDLINQIGSEHFEMLETIQTSSWQELDDYFQDKVSAGLEGIITKEIKTNYEPGTRNFKWIKLKANTQQELVDTIDVAVLGYFTGRGKRAKFGVGALLTGVYDPDTEQYYSIGKVGSGFTDENLAEIFKDLQELVIEDKPNNFDVEKVLYPDVWVQPKIIMELDADEITRSPNHTAGKGFATKIKNDDISRGLSIRFPRLKIWNRNKDFPNSVQEIVRMYELRKSK